MRVAVPGHPDWTLRFRKGYVPGDTRKENKDTTDDSPLVALSANALPTRDVPLRLGAVPLPGSGDVADIALALEVSAPRTALEDGDGRIRDELTYEVLIVDVKKDKVISAGGLSARITLSPARGGGPLPDTVSYQVADTITVRPGRYQLRVSAVSAKLATGGSVYLDLDVPDFRKARVAIGGVAIGYAAGPRVAATTGSPKRALPAMTPRTKAGASARTATTMPATPPPLLPFAPTLDRTFATTDTLRVYFEVASRDGMAGVNNMLAILGADRVTVLSSIPFVPGADGRVDLRVPLKGLAPGAHILRVTVTDGEHSATRETGFIVH